MARPSIPSRVSTQIRINDLVYQKTKAIAKLECRNTNSQIEYFLAQGVARYESEHGTVQLSEDSDDTLN